MYLMLYHLFFILKSYAAYILKTIKKYTSGDVICEHS